MPVDLTPSKGMREAAARGLELHAAGKSGDGLRPQTVREARQIARGDTLSEGKVRRMRAWLARHESDRREGWGTPGQETPGYVAWLLWGGDPAVAWSGARVSRLDRAAIEAEAISRSR
jgi:hypothetical protein